MYTPRPFREERIDVLHQAMVEIGAATIVGNAPEGLTATHAPIFLDPGPAPFGTLRCHFARANPQLNSFDSGQEVLIIFQGPQGYVSPSMYPSKQVTGEVVPTWNYVAIHARGAPSTFDDPGRLREHLTELTRHFESARTVPWKVDDAPADYIDRMCKAIVGVEIKLTGIEGKWKMSQNRSDADRLGVIAGFLSQGGGGRSAIAALVEGAMEESP